MKRYQIPKLQPIGNGATRLAELERRRNELIKKAATEQGKILKHNEAEFWSRSLPEQLASTLESFDVGSAQAAAIGYLRNQGFVVTIPKNSHYEFIDTLPVA